MATDLHVASEWQRGTPDAADSPIRVVLADDHVQMRRSLRMLLDGESDVEVVAEAGDQQSTQRQVHGHQPQVLVLDLRMPGGSSIETIRSLSEGVPMTRIVVVTMDDSPVFAQRALAAGALGFVTKDDADVELALAVRAASEGEQYVSPQMAARLDSLHRALTENKLTQREVEVLRLIALGHTSVEIARKLHLSPRTLSLIHI